ncbi:unnamed protein product [Cyclocybe aegerita]|uniref:Uncharacterized protein n=1 Tax=Cyclocybe aegerita TaxID=1973307 RepID=A0A8S0WN20_CYCAE|nr:unnamed protein product [Cyclocybe aegerita]
MVIRRHPDACSIDGEGEYALRLAKSERLLSALRTTSGAVLDQLQLQNSSPLLRYHYPFSMPHNPSFLLPTGFLHSPDLCEVYVHVSLVYANGVVKRPKLGRRRKSLKMNICREKVTHEGFDLQDLAPRIAPMYRLHEDYLPDLQHELPPALRMLSLRPKAINVDQLIEFAKETRRQIPPSHLNAIVMGLQSLQNGDVDNGSDIFAIVRLPNLINLILNFKDIFRTTVLLKHLMPARGWAIQAYTGPPLAFITSLLLYPRLATPLPNAVLPAVAGLFVLLALHHLVRGVRSEQAFANLWRVMEEFGHTLAKSKTPRRRDERGSALRRSEAALSRMGAGLYGTLSGTWVALRPEHLSCLTQTAQAHFLALA